MVGPFQNYPPHEDEASLLDFQKQARAKGIRVYPIASSGVAGQAEWAMRQLAAFTLGRYLFLTDDSGIGDSHAEPHIPCYHVELLQELMIRVIESALIGEWVPSASGERIRSVGFDEQGNCVGVEQTL